MTNRSAFRIIATACALTGGAGCVIVPFPHESKDVYLISGRVLDQRTRKPVPKANVVLVGLPATATQSDAQGRFVTSPSKTLHLLGIYTYDGIATQFPPRKRTASGPLRISHPGYQTRDVPVDARRPLDEMFTTEPVPIPLHDIYLNPRTR